MQVRLKLIVTVLLLTLCAAGAVAAQPAKISTKAAKKIADAMPASLPQAPKDDRPRSDAQDIGLKGTVLSVTYRRSETGDRRYPKKILKEEEFYSEDGNRIRTVYWEDIYPTGVHVYGYIDGMRVSRYGDVVYAPGEKPEESCVPLVHTVLGPKDEGYVKGDDRYNNRLLTRHDALGRLADEQLLGNGGQLLTRTVYSYEAANRRTLLLYIGGTSPIAKIVEIFDPATGDMVEEWIHDEKGNVRSTLFYTYKYDALGNWTVQRVTEKDTFENSKPKLVSSAYRTITYYP